jgi:hypothetical protein
MPTSLRRLSIPSKHASSFRRDIEVLEANFDEVSSSPSELCSRSLMHRDKILEPSWLCRLGYPEVTMLVQRPGEWVFTHTCCPHMEISHHAGLRESVALPLPFLAEVVVRAADCLSK